MSQGFTRTIPPAVITIRPEHPRLIDLDALAVKFAAPEYATWQSTLTTEANSGDAAAAALLWKLTGDTVRRDAAISRLVNNNIVRLRWHRDGPQLQALLAADLVLDDMSAGQKTSAWATLRAHWTLGTLPRTSRSGVDTYRNGYFWNDMFLHRVARWAVMMVFANTGVDDAAIADEMEAIRLTTSPFHSPWEAIDCLYLLSGEEGGRPVGRQSERTAGWGSGYRGYFIHQPIVLYEGMRHGIGQDLRQRNTYTTRAARNYFASARNLRLTGDTNLHMELATGQATGDDAALSRWLLDKDGRRLTGNPVMRLVYGDMRVQPKTPEQVGLQLTSYEAGDDLWYSYSSYTLETADRVLLRTEQQVTVGRVELLPSILEIWNGTNVIAIADEQDKNLTNGSCACCHWISRLDGSGSGPGRTEANSGYRELPSYILGLTEPQRSNYFDGPPVYVGSGAGWAACTTNSARYFACGGVQKSWRTVVHLVSARIVVVRDLIQANADRVVRIPWRHNVEAQPITIPGGHSWLHRGATFTAFADHAEWTGGVGAELINLVTRYWIGNNRNGFTRGYGADPSKARMGIGQVELTTAPADGVREFITVIDIGSQHTPQRVADGVVVSTYKVTFQADGSVNVIDLQLSAHQVRVVDANGKVVVDQQVSGVAPLTVTVAPG